MRAMVNLEGGIAIVKIKTQLNTEYTCIKTKITQNKLQHFYLDMIVIIYLNISNLHYIVTQ